MSTIATSILPQDNTSSPEITCNYVGCDGKLHGDQADDMVHSLHYSEFDDVAGACVCIDEPREENFVFVEFDLGVSRELTADETRALADKFEAFPDWLRAHAERLDAVSAR